MSSYLIVHKMRNATVFGNDIIYHDSFCNNQDPYIWSDPFLYSFCKSFWLAGQVGKDDYLFFVTADSVVNGLNKNRPVYCDLVFRVGDIYTWQQNNTVPLQVTFQPPISNWNNGMWQKAVDNHLIWPSRGVHQWKKRNLITYIANSDFSFQPQININPPKIKNFINLIDISSVLPQAPGNISLSHPMLLTVADVTSILNYISANCNNNIFAQHLTSLSNLHGGTWMSSNSRRIARPTNRIII